MARSKNTVESTEQWIRNVMADGRSFDLKWPLKHAALGTDGGLIADSLLWLLRRDPFELGRMRCIPPQGLRAFPSRLEPLPECEFPALPICAREMLDPAASDDVLKKQWERVSQLAWVCRSSGYDKRKTHSQLKKLAGDPASVAGAQALARAKLQWLGGIPAVLAIDGSSTSLSLLEQLIDEALERNELRELRYMAKLRMHTTVEASLELIGRIDARITSELAIWNLIEWFGTSEEVAFNLLVQARPAPNRQRVWMLVHVSNDHFTLAVTDDGTGKATTIRMTSDSPATFSAERDDFGLGSCLPTELPTFLPRAAECLAVEWDYDAWQLNADTRKQALARWLRSGQLPSRKTGLDSRYYSRS